MSLSSTFGVQNKGYYLQGEVDYLLQSHKDRAVQLAAAIQNTKDIIAGYINKNQSISL